MLKYTSSIHVFFVGNHFESNSMKKDGLDGTLKSYEISQPIRRYAKLWKKQISTLRKIQLFSQLLTNGKGHAHDTLH